MAVNTKDEDRAIAKAARAAIVRAPIDISELNITCNGGTIELMGKVKPLRGSQGEVSIRKEFKVIQTQIATVRGVKGVYADRVAIYD